ncbi:MAG: carbohydrate binding family 9 domain-containing protein [Bacteroidetes bacterium]|nr:carbohydrate binding family 9 domain-containing protein [Bacteroidota bacterium]
MKKLYIILLFFGILNGIFSQNKSVNAVRTFVSPKIDGVLDDTCWAKAEIAGDFIQRDLHPGLPTEQKTEVKILYDNAALYISAMLYDTSPDSILRELSTRDNEANAELFGVFFDTYNDDINAYGFFVTSAGTQIDARYSTDTQDFDWNAVWMSSVKINEKGWAVEMRIPYSAVRFTAKEIQTWGFNSIRKVRRLRENSFWNPVNPKINALVRQFGDLTGLENIKPPVRLSFSPYIASIINHYPYNDANVKNLTYNLSGGMDVKYGLSDAFTLDMTLVPDFSQVQSDNQVLNLSPFEVQFQERRPFFTEGTELFNKGGLFYSRRVGGTPIKYNAVAAELKDGEKIIKNPTQTQLLNATKLSGRTNKKLGIGVFNAVSNNMYATVQDTLGVTRSILTSPLTNYNIIVFDQALKNNSFVNLINTNVTREGHFYDANVTGTGFRFNNKKNIYSIGGGAIMSNRFYPDSLKPYTGYSCNLDLGKNGGNFKWNIYGSLNTDKYNPNDLGILLLTNNMETGLNLIYNVYKPFWKVNNSYNSVNIAYQRMYVPNAFWNFGIYGNHVTTFTKRFFTCGLNYAIEPVVTYDYYEPRIFGRFYTYPVNYNAGGFISSDYRKPFALDVSTNYRIFNENNRHYFNLSVSPRYRANNKLSFIYEAANNLRNDDIGFVHYDPYGDTITFGRRNMQTVSNTFSSVYKFTNKMSLSFRLRHYWSKAKYSAYYQLGDDGYLNPYTNYPTDHNVNFNAFNIDMVYYWQFAPGSELNVVWKNSVLKRENTVNNDYYDNFRGSFNTAQNNMISVKVLYYIDYLYLKKAFSKVS